MVHNREDIHPSHKVFITQKSMVKNGEGKILVMRRTKTAPTRPLDWDIPGGGLQFGEDPKVGVAREVREETGLEIKNIKPIEVISFLNPNKEFWVHIYYQADALSDSITLSFEHDQHKWITKEEFSNLDIPERFKNLLKKV